jgi:hypothetical protein
MIRIDPSWRSTYRRPLAMEAGLHVMNQIRG